VVVSKKKNAGFHFLKPIPGVIVGAFRSENSETAVLERHFLSRIESLFSNAFALLIAIGKSELLYKTVLYSLNNLVVPYQRLLLFLGLKTDNSVQANTTGLYGIFFVSKW
jgi:hypothetical protein